MMWPESTMKRACGPTNDVDRLSALPDEVLYAILSFLPAQQAVQTSLLSQRWRRLWRSNPLVKIDERDFGISSMINDETMVERWERFEDFATNLLLFRDTTSVVDEFRLLCGVHNWCHVDRWIHRGIGYCPFVLQIELLGYVSGFKLPPRRFTLHKINLHLRRPSGELLGSLCNVTNLELIGFEVEVMLNENPNTFPIFHNLRTLNLYDYFLDEYEQNDKLEALGSFLQTAPCLEKLRLHCCMWEIERKSITLQYWDGKILCCPKLKLIEVIYDYDHDHQLIELVWNLGRSLPDANIKLNKIES